MLLFRIKLAAFICRSWSDYLNLHPRSQWIWLIRLRKCVHVKKLLELFQSRNLSSKHTGANSICLCIYCLWITAAESFTLYTEVIAFFHCDSGTDYTTLHYRKTDVWGRHGDKMDKLPPHHCMDKSPFHIDQKKKTHSNTDTIGIWGQVNRINDSIWTWVVRLKTDQRKLYRFFFLLFAWKQDIR